ncbi:YncE family protein [Photobacterium kishitanii]|uniref:YncE family protein n=1 Tax=Photobacterium kishitanii TaxID=318456 RepID=UPI0015E7D4D1|nr:hypothetical protein [Photobacterium kishitanii]
MKKNKISFAIVTTLIMANPSYAVSEQEYFTQTYNTAYNQINNTIEELREYASDDSNVIVQDGKRHIEVNGAMYEINSDNYLLFPFKALGGFFDEKRFRTVFDFLDQDWELSWYDNGMVAVNKVFGNYDWGNGCLLKYIPEGFQGDTGFERFLIDTNSCAVNDFDTSIDLLKKPTLLTPSDYGLESFTPTAIEHYKNRLYVTDDRNPGVILIIDVNTKEQIGTIDGFTKDDIHHPYRRINELNIYKNHLYVASLSSNRVDVYDLDNNHAHIMSMGTGRYSGTNSLTHAQASVANDNYVFASDSNNIISVYRQQDIIPKNHYRLARVGRLQFEGTTDIYRTVKMHLIGDSLIVNIKGNKYYIYDLNELESAIANDQPLIAKKIVNSNLQQIDINNNTIVAAYNNRVEFHASKTFIANDFEFIKPISTLHSVNEGNAGNYHDILLLEDMLITAKPEAITLNKFDRLQISYTADKLIEDTKVKFASLLPTSISPVLSNDEPFEILTNSKLRSVYINKLVKTELVDNDMVRITNYAAQALKDIDVELKIGNINKWFTLANIDTIPAFTQITLPLSSFGQNQQFNSVNDDGFFDLSNLFASDSQWKNLIDHKFSSKTDPFAQMLASLKPNWNISFRSNYGGSYVKMNALYAREWLIIMTNLAYMISQEEFKHLWFNFESVFGYNMHGNAGPNSVSGGYFTPEDYQYYYEGLMNRYSISLGITSIGGGRGSFSGFSVDTWMFYTHYYGTWGVIMHEFGHGFDGKQTYSHHTSFANNSNGWQPMMTDLANYHIRKGDLPYMDDNINGFYKDENAQYRHNTVNHSMRKHRPDDIANTVERYFLSLELVDFPNSWFPHTSQFNLDKLNAVEKKILAKINVDNMPQYACRFEFTELNESQTLYGYVEKTSDVDYSCVGGTQNRYRMADGSMIPLQSKPNQFDWLSLYNPQNSGRQVTTEAGIPLCSSTHNEYYGLGFQKRNNICEQNESVRVPNGNHWAIGTHYRTYTYL